MATAKNVQIDSSPADLEEIAKSYQDILAKSNIPYSFDRTLSDMKRRAADLNKISVVEWEEMWARKLASPAPTPPPAAPAPAKPSKKKADPASSQGQRGSVATIDRNYFWMSEENRAVGKTWMALRKQGGIVMNMLAVGPSGCGKTEGLARLAEENGIPFYKVDCASITTPDKWVGHKDVVATEQGSQTTYVLSEHLRWLSADGFEPGLVVYDEINRLHPQLLNLLIPILDGSQSIWVPDLGIYVKVHPDTMIAATANLGVGFSGTYGFDVALADRFGVVMEQTFPPADEELTILERKTGISRDQANVLIDIARRARDKAAEGALSKPVSTRALIDCANWVSTGMTITQAAEATFVKKYSEDGQGQSERAMIRLILQGLTNGN